MNWDRIGRATLNKGGSWSAFCNAKTIVKVMVIGRMTVMPKVRISLLSLSHSGPFSGSIASTPSAFSTFLQSLVDACS